MHVTVQPHLSTALHRPSLARPRRFDRHAAFRLDFSDLMTLPPTMQDALLASCHDFGSTPLSHTLIHNIMSSEQVEATSSTSALAVTNGSAANNGDSNAVSNGNGNGQSKPRARLGPIETVTLPPDDSDSEPEDDEAPDAEGGEAAGEDFLKDYPDDTEVHHITSCDK